MLNDSERDLFYTIFFNLVWHINKKHRIVRQRPKPTLTDLKAPLEEFMEVRDAMWENPAWIDEFLGDGASGTETDEQREIIADWRARFIKDTFYVVKHTAKHTIVMMRREPVKLYAVTGISNHISLSNPSKLPFLLEMILLPFKGKIIYDSLLRSYNVSLGKGIIANLKIEYKESKKEFGIIHSLDTDPTKA
ncbi:MAG: hypothetical protein LBF58_11560 [Deltaproteobacteria bacterium]|jgi:hypothetical protein|nr:hypothetical protein [Deltaproteobacteria bacterium]